jgi:serine/threonine protein kinase
MGTPLFMAPEMLDGDTSDVKSDIWSVGITAIQMAQGRPPYYNLHPARVRHTPETDKHISKYLYLA